MKIRKLILLIVGIMILTSCGATIGYNVDVNTIDKTMNVQIKMDIEDSDYEYIEGGREKLLSIINNKKPKELEFVYDSNNADTYVFKLSFSSYKEYLKKFKSITGEESVSTFNMADFSRGSPFLEYQDIIMDDDLSKLIKWLTDDLITTGAISKGHESNLIASESYTYTFDDEKNYEGEYSSKNTVEMKDIALNIVAKKEGKVDVHLKFVVIDPYKEFLNNFESYLKDRKVSIKYTYSHKKTENKNILYEIDINDLDVSSKKTNKELNELLGEKFLNLITKQTKEDSFFKDNIIQNTNVSMIPYKLFNTEIDNSVLLKITVEDVEATEGSTIKPPYEVPVEETYMQSLITEYSEINYLNVVLLIIIALVIIPLIVFFIKRVKRKELKEKWWISKIVLWIDSILNKGFVKDFIIKENVIEGKSFVIQISTIDKANCNIQFIDEKMLKRFGKIFIILSIALYLEWTIMIIIGALSLLIYGLLIFRKIQYHLLKIRLMSGNEYIFQFESKEILNEKYIELITILDEKLEVDNN